MGNCIKDPAPLELEIRPSVLRESVSNDAPPQLNLTHLADLPISPEADRKDATSPSSSAAMRSDVMTFDRTAEISKSIENLTKQMDHSRVWQEGECYISEV